MTNNLSAAQDLYSSLTLNELKELIEPFRNTKILAGITCNPKFYDYIFNISTIIKNKTLPKDSLFSSFHGTPLYKINNQKENIKYFYSQKELEDYLKKNK